jgi:hypothetical protein
VKRKALIVGWFSFEQMGASAGDLLARDLTCDWLRAAGWEFDVAHAPPFAGGIDWRTASPGGYARVIFVCGPFGNGPPLLDFLGRFKRRPMIGLNLTMLQPLEEWNPFRLLLERDSSAARRPDMCFASEQPHVPVVGLVLIDTQPEYEDDMMHVANEAIARLVASREMSIVRIDTRLDVNTTGLRTPREIESLIARMDTVISTRLHGMVLAIKNAVPVLAIDAVRGGAKVLNQAKAIRWPTCFTADQLDDRALSDALDTCLGAAGRQTARECRDYAIAQVARTRDELIRHLAEATA